MVNSLSYNGVRLDSIEGVCWESASRPIAPAPKELKISPSNMDGDYNFWTANVDKRPHYDSLVHSGVFHISGRNLTDCQIKANRLMSILFSNMGEYCKIIFDDTPNTVWLGVHDGTSKVTYEGYKRIDIEVNFSCYPFPTHKCSPIKSKLTFSGSSIYSFNNVGTWFTRPVLRLTGSFSKLRVNYRGVSLVYSGVSTGGDVTVVDFEEHMVYKNGQPMGEYLEGEFKELSSGVTVFNFSCTGSCTCEFEYVPYFVGNAEGVVIDAKNI